MNTQPKDLRAELASVGEDAALAAAFREVAQCSYAQDGIAGELFKSVKDKAAALTSHGGGGEAVAEVRAIGGVYDVRWLVPNVVEAVRHGTKLYTTPHRPEVVPPPEVGEEPRGEGMVLVPRDHIRGHLPAPLTNPESWPPNYADGWNDCAQTALDGLTIALAVELGEPNLKEKL